MSEAKECAKKALWYYFNIIAKKAGVSLDYNCKNEIEGVVDDIISATIDEIISYNKKN